MKQAACVMVLGCTSGAGKSWLATALCRWYARQGYRVAPFKAQNMSNNARVVTGGEIGSAQYFQALAAGVEPEVRMNPLLLKPEADTRSQVVLLGQVDAHLTALPWRERKNYTWQPISEALDALRSEYDVVVIEGAGSPAEINLMDTDVVNLRVARHAQAASVLVADIDRGGAFAHLYGTWALMPEADRRLLRGFVLNKFRGDASLLPPAPQMLQDMTQVPVLATLPLWRGHGLPEEDGVFDDSSTGQQGQQIAVIAYPHMSNLDEFEPLRQNPNVRLRWVREPAALQAVDCVVLPGSKNTLDDLRWLRERGLDAAINAHAARGGRVLGICGGLQMLGEAVMDLHSFEGGGSEPGLGLLPVVTLFEPNKTVQRTQATVAADLPTKSPWYGLRGLPVDGYEIHMGQTQAHAGMVQAGHVAQPALRAQDGAVIGWCNGTATACTPQAGQVLGVYLHGLLENADVQQQLFGAAVPSLHTVFDSMADYVEHHFGADALRALLKG